MPMWAKGLAKLSEELGEAQEAMALFEARQRMGRLSQIVGKKFAYFETDDHPDGGPPLRLRLSEEIADVIAACIFVVWTFGINWPAMLSRIDRKVRLFKAWHREVNNNAHSVDGNRSAA